MALSITVLSAIMLNVAFFVTLGIIMLSVIVLSTILLTVNMRSVIAP